MNLWIMLIKVPGNAFSHTVASDDWLSPPGFPGRGLMGSTPTLVSGACRTFSRKEMICTHNQELKTTDPIAGRGSAGRSRNVHQPVTPPTPIGVGLTKSAVCQPNTVTLREGRTQNHNASLGFEFGRVTVFGKSNTPNDLRRAEVPCNAIVKIPEPRTLLACFLTDAPKSVRR